MMIDICGSTAFPEEGYITSPGYPAKVTKTKDCSRTLIPSTNQSLIAYNLIDLDMDLPQLCQDKVEVSDPIQNQKVTYCGNLKDNVQPTSQNYSALSIRYAHIFGTISDVRGFLIHYKCMYALK